MLSMDNSPLIRNYSGKATGARASSANPTKRALQRIKSNNNNYFNNNNSVSNSYRNTGDSTYYYAGFVAKRNGPNDNSYNYSDNSPRVSLPAETFRKPSVASRFGSNGNSGSGYGNSAGNSNSLNGPGANSDNSNTLFSSSLPNNRTNSVDLLKKSDVGNITNADSNTAADISNTNSNSNSYSNNSINCNGNGYKLMGNRFDIRQTYGEMSEANRNKENKGKVMMPINGNNLRSSLVIYQTKSENRNNSGNNGSNSTINMNNNSTAGHARKNSFTRNITNHIMSAAAMSTGVEDDINIIPSHTNIQCDESATRMRSISVASGMSNLIEEESTNSNETNTINSGHKKHRRKKSVKFSDRLVSYSPDHGRVGSTKGILVGGIIKNVHDDAKNYGTANHLQKSNNLNVMQNSFVTSNVTYNNTYNNTYNTTMTAVGNSASGANNAGIAAVSEGLGTEKAVGLKLSYNTYKASSPVSPNSGAANVAIPSAVELAMEAIDKSNAMGTSRINTTPTNTYNLIKKNNSLDAIKSTTQKDNNSDEHFQAPALRKSYSTGMKETDALEKNDVYGQSYTTSQGETNLFSISTKQLLEELDNSTLGVQKVHTGGVSLELIPPDQTKRKSSAHSASARLNNFMEVVSAPGQKALAINNYFNNSSESNDSADQLRNSSGESPMTNYHQHSGRHKSNSLGNKGGNAPFSSLTGNSPVTAVIGDYSPSTEEENEDNTKSFIFTMPMKSIAFGTITCKQASPIAFYKDRFEFCFMHPFEANETKMSVAYTDMISLVLSGTKMKFKLPKSVAIFRSDFDPQNPLHLVTIDLSSMLSATMVKEKVLPFIRH